MAGKNSKSLSSRRLCGSWFVIFALFFSCKSAPVAQEIAEADSLPLDSGAFAYIFTDVNKARPLLGILPVGELKTWQALLILESTDTAAAALFQRESGRRFQISGWGKYPSFRAGLALFFSRNWRRQRSPEGNYWTSAADKLSISLGSKQVFAVSWHDNPGNPRPSAQGVKMPEGFSGFMRGSPLSCWLEEPSGLLTQILNDQGIPIRLPAERLFISIFPSIPISANSPDTAELKYESVIRLQFENVSQARAITAVLTMANAFMPQGSSSQSVGPVLASIFFGNPPVQNGRNLDIRSAPLSEKEISLLLEMFLLYWR